jgi:hypothetical protein
VTEENAQDEQAGCGMQKLARETLLLGASAIGAGEAGDMRYVKSTAKQPVIYIVAQNRTTKDDAEAAHCTPIRRPRHQGAF